MEDLHTTTEPGDSLSAAIDPSVLDQILNLGDAQLRGALLEQLLADFQRLADALSDGSWEDVGAAAHELKGLAATIGAHRLAQLARGLDKVADCQGAGDIGKFRAPLQGEIRVVLDSLAAHAGGVRS